jgi:predicted dehydrogenase
VPTVWASWEDALGVPADAVVVATPVESHATIARAALDAGRHVYVEKPMAAGLGEAVALAAAATGAGRILQVGHAYRFHPLWRRVRALVDAGRLVPPFAVTATFDALAAGAGWRHPVVDVGIHHVDLVSWLCGAPPVAARATDDGRLVVSWRDGTTLAGTYAPGPGADRATVRDARGAVVVVDRLRGLRLGGRGTRLGMGRLPAPALVRARLSGAGWERSFEWALGAFVAAVRRGVPHPWAAGPAAGAEAVAVAAAALRSLGSGRTEPVEPPGTGGPVAPPGAGEPAAPASGPPGPGRAQAPVPGPEVAAGDATAAVVPPGPGGAEAPVPERPGPGAPAAEPRAPGTAGCPRPEPPIPEPPVPEPPAPQVPEPPVPEPPAPQVPELSPAPVSGSPGPAAGDPPTRPALLAPDPGPVPAARPGAASPPAPPAFPVPLASGPDPAQGHGGARHGGGMPA